MLLDLMLEFHAWSTARPAHESDVTADALENEVKAVMELEKEQGMFSPSPSLSLVGRPVFSTDRHTPSSCPLRTRELIYASCFKERTRQRLNEFVTRIKLALAALTGATG